MNAMLVTAAVLGLAGSAHCVGMCGPIALAVPLGHARAAHWRGTVLLNAGRLLTYGFIGAVFGTFGSGLRLAGLQQVVTITAGTILLLSVILPGALRRWLPASRFTQWLGSTRALLARNLRRTSSGAMFFTGMLNGMLPCGLVYAAALGAATMATPMEGVAYMLLFGLGTWPALFAVRLGGAAVTGRTRSLLRKAAPALTVAVALLMILRGADLGVPYLSPDLPRVGTQVQGCH